MPEIRRFLMDVVFDEAAAEILKEDEWWFESEDGIPMKCVEACKQAFMGQLKEADFIRWGNTKRMTSLRKAEQDGIWEGIKEHNFDDFWRVASKVTPTTAPTRTQSPPPSSASVHGRPPSADPGNVPDRDGAYSVRCIPVRVYLPDGPILQDLVPPMVEDGKTTQLSSESWLTFYAVGSPNTLGQYLATHIPLLFPLQPPPPPPSRTNPNPQAPAVQQLAYALIQGVLAPPEAEMAWLGHALRAPTGGSTYVLD
ncbi:autophagy protein [Salix suchowensis]|nr:autophagy protein [Salix suchowensis]